MRGPILYATYENKPESLIIWLLGDLPRILNPHGHSSRANMGLFVLLPTPKYGNACRPFLLGRESHRVRSDEHDILKVYNTWSRGLRKNIQPSLHPCSRATTYHPVMIHSRTVRESVWTTRTHRKKKTRRQGAPPSVSRSQRLTESTSVRRHPSRQDTYGSKKKSRACCRCERRGK